MNIMKILLFLVATQQTHSWNNNAPRITRRKALVDFTSAVFTTTTGLLLLTPTLFPTVAAAAPPKPPPMYLKTQGSADIPLSPCPGQPLKKNCWSTEDTQSRRLARWVPPPNRSSAVAILQDIESVINSYPQEGQNGVDKGGWRLADRQTNDAVSSVNQVVQSHGVTYLRYEFVSGRFGYVDDLEIRVVDDKNGSGDGVVEIAVRTASREGGYDFNVNAVRIDFIQAALQKKGWTVQMVQSS
jgi:uncharacterized protein (DUF1499 family)